MYNNSWGKNKGKGLKNVKNDLIRDKKWVCKKIINLNGKNILKILILENSLLRIP